MAVLERTIQFTSEAGFPTKIYLNIIGWLVENGYEVSKVKDWLEVNPKTAYHQDVIQRRAALEQSLGRVMSNISELRKDIEMIKHDLRKFEQVSKHCKTNDDNILKSDFIDLVDDPSKPGSLIQLQAKGRFPSIVIDFMRVKSKEDIKKLKASQSEKNILEIKQQLFEEWKSEYCTVVDERVTVLKEEYNSRIASLENYKHSIQPYLQALNKIKISEGHYRGLTDPLIVEGYSTSVAGVDLVAFRGMNIQEKFFGHHKSDDEKENRERYSHYVYFDIKFKRETITIKGQEMETMRLDIKTDIKDNHFIKAKRKEIDSLEKSLEQELKEFKGDSEKPLPEEKKEELKGISKLLESFKKSTKKHSDNLRGKKGEYFIGKDAEKPLKDIVYEESIKFYDDVKTMLGGLLLKHSKI